MNEVLQAAKQETVALDNLRKAMDIFISNDRNRAIVIRRKKIEVKYIPTYDVYVKNGMFDFGRIPF